jgi:hypothetical protein
VEKLSQKRDSIGISRLGKLPGWTELELCAMALGGDMSGFRCRLDIQSSVLKRLGQGRKLENPKRRAVSLRKRY